MDDKCAGSVAASGEVEGGGFAGRALDGECGDAGEEGPSGRRISAKKIETQAGVGRRKVR